MCVCVCGPLIIQPGPVSVAKVGSLEDNNKVKPLNYIS